MTTFVILLLICSGIQTPYHSGGR